MFYWKAGMKSEVQVVCVKEVMHRPLFAEDYIGDLAR